VQSGRTSGDRGLREELHAAAGRTPAATAGSASDARGRAQELRGEAAIKVLERRSNHRADAQSQPEVEVEVESR
jgi:hypothetical protein